MTKEYAEGYFECMNDCISIIKTIGEAIIQNKNKEETLKLCASALTDLSIKRKLAKTQMKEGI